MIILIPHHHYTVCTPIICFYRCKCIFVSLLFHTHQPSSWGVSIATLSSSATCFCQILSMPAKLYLIFYLGHLFDCLFVLISNLFLPDLIQASQIIFYLLSWEFVCSNIYLFSILYDYLSVWLSIILIVYPMNTAREINNVNSIIFHDFLWISSL